jgi:glycosyltransferase involved in cell wall biosynthesis
LLSETTPTEAVSGRIVVVCGSLQPGGAERQVVNTLAGLVGAPHVESVTLLCDHLRAHTADKYDFYLPLAQSSGVQPRIIRNSWNDSDRASLPRGFAEVASKLPFYSNLLSDVANLYFEFRAMRPQVVHAWLDWSNVRAGLAAILAGVPRIVLSGRNLSPRHFALNTDYFHPAYSAVLERSGDQVPLLNNSQAGADDYAKWLSFPLERIGVIRNGVRFTEDMRPSCEHNDAFRSRLGIPTGAPIVGGMFRFNPEKRPLLWLETAARVAASVPDAHFVIFGEGPLRHTMKNVISAEGIKARTHLCGIVTPSFEGLSPCDLILLTSSGEGTPNVLLEAQSLGIPVVTTDAGGAGEAVLDGVTGVVMRTSDADAIAQAVVRVLRDEVFHGRARRQGPWFIATQYGVERMVRETLAAYRLDHATKCNLSETQDNRGALR